MDPFFSGFIFKGADYKAKLTLVSATSIVEGGAHDVLLKDKAPYASNTR